MRKIFTILLAVMLIASLTISAYAITPKWEYKAVKLPEIKFTSVENIVSNWFNQRPTEIPAIEVSYTHPLLG